MANPFKAILKGLKATGKAAWANKEIVVMLVPASGPVASLIKGGIGHVDGLIKGGKDPGSGTNRRAEAIKWIREQLPASVKDYELLAALSDEELAAWIESEIMKRKYPEMFE